MKYTEGLPKNQVKKSSISLWDYDLSRLRSEIKLALKLALEEVGIEKMPFPKPNVNWLSYYEYDEHSVLDLLTSTNKAHTPQINYGVFDFLTTVIDFSFVRDILATTYSPRGNPNCHDPVSLFLLHQAYTLHQFQHYIDYHRLISGKSSYAKQIREQLGFADPNTPQKQFTYDDLRQDEELIKNIGISSTYFPSQSTVCDFIQNRLTPDHLTKIFHVINAFFIHWLNLNEVRFSIIGIDGCGFPGLATYKGCNQYTPDCSNITINLKDWGADIRRKLSENPQEIKLNLEYSFQISCPFIQKWQSAINDGKHSPRFQLFRYSFVRVNKPYYTSKPKPDDVEEQIVHRLGIADLLNKFSVRMIISNCLDLSFTGEHNCVIQCPKIPSDFASKMYVRNGIVEDTKTFIFGYNLILLVAYYPMIDLELPVAYLVIEGNADEGKQINSLINEQLKIFRNFKKGELKVFIGDSKFDIEENYESIRQEGGVPLIDYNPRNETFPKEIKSADGKTVNLSKNLLPLCPQGVETSPNGYDQASHRVDFSCNKNCDKYLLNPHPDCPYLNQGKEYRVKIKVYIDNRAILEIPRTSATYKALYSLRSGNERLNSIGKNLGLKSKLFLKYQTNLAKGGLVAIGILTKKVYLFLLNNQLTINDIKAGWKNKYDSLFPAMNPLLERFFPPQYRGVPIAVN